MLVVDPAIAAVALGDCIVLLRQGGRQLYILNESAALIFRGVQNGQNVTSLAQALSSSCAMEPDQALANTRNLLEQWQASGIMAEGYSPPTVTESSLPPLIRQLPRESTYSISSSYNLAGHSVTLRHNLPEVQAGLAALLPHLLQTPGPQADNTLTVDLEDGAYTLLNNDIRVASANSQDQIVVEIISEMVNIPAAADRLFCVLHACCVTRDNITIALAGSGGSGKTTLTAALIQSGYGFVTDDVIPLHSDDLSGRPAPIQMNLCIKRGSFEPLQAYYPELDSLPTFDRLGQVVKFLPPPANSLWAQEPAPVSVVIFPQYSPEQAGNTREISHVEALELLVVTDSKIGPRLDEEKFTQLVEWLQTTRCFCVDYGSTEEGMQRVGDIGGIVSADRGDVAFASDHGSTW